MSTTPLLSELPAPLWAKLHACGIREPRDLETQSLEDLLSTCPLSAADLLVLRRAMERAGRAFLPGAIRYPFCNPVLLREVQAAGIDVSRTSIASIGLPGWAESPLLAGGLESIGELAEASTFYVRTVLGLGGRPHSILRHHLEEYLTRLLHSATAPTQDAPEGALVQTLPLNPRTLGALRRAGVFTAEQLQRMTDEELAKLRGLGPGRVAEIKALLPGASPQPSADPALQAEAVSLRPEIAARSLTELHLPPNLVRRLQSAGITSIGQLVEGGEELLTEVPRVGTASARRIRAHLERYLLRELQDIGANVPEIVAEVQGEASEGTLDERLAGLVSRLGSERVREIVTWRHGLDGRLRTLEEAGRQLGISRERVRQLERLGIQTLQREQPAQVDAVSRPVYEALAAVGGVAPFGYILEQLPVLFRIHTVSLTGAARLLTELSRDCVPLPGRRVALRNAPVDEVERIDDTVVAYLRKGLEPVAVADLTTELARTRCYPLVVAQYPSFSLAARARANPLTETLPSGAIVLREWARTRLDNTVRALRELGRPSHYRQVAAQVQSRLPDGTQVSEDAIHNLLLSEAAFVRKDRGVFGLAEWESGEPDTARAIEQVLRAADGPLHREEVARLLRMDERVVERCLLTRPEFTPAGQGYYRLSDREYSLGSTSQRRRTTVLVQAERGLGRGLSARLLITQSTRQSGTVALNSVLRPLLPSEGEVEVAWPGSSTAGRNDKLYRGRAHLSGLHRFLRSERVSPGEYVYLEHRPDQHPSYLLYTESQWKALSWQTAGASEGRARQEAAGE